MASILHGKGVCDELVHKKNGFRKLITQSGNASVSGIVFLRSGNTHKTCDVEQ